VDKVLSWVLSVETKGIREVRKIPGFHDDLCDIEKDRRSVSPARASQWAKTLGYDPEQFIELALQGELFNPNNAFDFLILSKASPNGHFPLSKSCCSVVA
jgi:hypothetical protein